MTAVVAANEINSDVSDNEKVNVVVPSNKFCFYCKQNNLQTLNRRLYYSAFPHFVEGRDSSPHVVAPAEVPVGKMLKVFSPCTQPVD